MINYKIYTSYKELPKSWNILATNDIFLQADYLKALEEASPTTISLYYVGVFSSDELVGVSIIQRVEIYAKDVFRSYNSSILKEFFKSSISKILKGNILVIGNLTHTGQHGLLYKKEKISQSEYLDTLFKSTIQLKKNIKQNIKKNIRIIMLKDFFLDDSIHLEKEFFKSHQLNKVFVQPNMIMNVKPSWLTFHDYYDSFNKKYKRRYKTARKKFNSTVVQEMDLESIHSNLKLMYALYLNVSNNAKVNTFILPENHFYIFKKHLKERFKVFGYFLDNKLVGFYTLIINNASLETYFLGYDDEHQYKNQLYLNMLYDMAKFGIENGLSSIVYARTAMEIKSSVGAKKEDMVVYMKHTNIIANFLFRQIFNTMNPAQKWSERHPFKT